MDCPKFHFVKLEKVLHSKPRKERRFAFIDLNRMSKLEDIKYQIDTYNTKFLF